MICVNSLEEEEGGERGMKEEGEGRIEKREKGREMERGESK